ncbi:DNA primase family protein [Enterococcus sp. LJL98]
MNELPEEIMRSPAFTVLSQPSKVEPDLLEPTSLKNVKHNLKILGDEWRKEHATYNEKTGEEKVKPVSARAIADILKKVCVFASISEDDPELSALSVFNPDTGVYENGEKFIDRLTLSVERTANKMVCATVRHFLAIETDDKSRTTDKNLVLVKNGVYNRRTHELEPFNHNYIFTSKVATSYVKGAEEPVFDGWKFSDWLKNDIAQNDSEKEKMLWQVIALAINSSHPKELAFFLVSEQGRSGKGSFQQTLINLIGRTNTASLKIKEFEKDFKLAQAYGKTLVIGDDNHIGDWHATSENFKSVVTGDLVLLNPKNEKPFATRLTPLVVQSMNGIPRFKDTTHGLLRRLRVILFNTSYTEQTNNKDIKEKYIYDDRLLEFILAKAIDMDIDTIANTKESQEALKDLEYDNNPILAFYEEIFPQFTSKRLPIKFLFATFQAYSDVQNNPTKIKQNTFTKQLKSVLEGTEWSYERKNLAPLDKFNKSDIEVLKEMNLNYKYSYGEEVEPLKTQSLVYRI